MGVTSEDAWSSRFVPEKISKRERASSGGLVEMLSSRNGVPIGDVPAWLDLCGEAEIQSRRSQLREPLEVSAW